MMNKRGDSNTTWIILGLVLGILIIGFIIWGFTDNWNTLRSFFPTDSVGVIVQQCAVKCELGQSGAFEYCNTERTVRITSQAGNIEPGRYKATCYAFADHDTLESYFNQECQSLCSSDTSRKITNLKTGKLVGEGVNTQDNSVIPENN